MQAASQAKMVAALMDVSHTSIRLVEEDTQTILVAMAVQKGEVQEGGEAVVAAGAAPGHRYPEVACHFETSRSAASGYCWPSESVRVAPVASQVYDLGNPHPSRH